MSIINDFQKDFYKQDVVCYMSYYSYFQYVVKKGKIGRKDGLFVIPKKQSKELEKSLEKYGTIYNQTNDFRKQLAINLGLYENEFQFGVIKLIIPYKFIKNLRIPCGEENGCNNKWIKGGQLISGIREGIINQIDKKKEPLLYNYIIKHVVGL